jgi:hypothetical protein
MTSRLVLLAAALVLTGCGSCGYPDNKIGKILPGMTVDEVTKLLGQPVRIDHSESNDQTITGEVYHYPSANGEARVIFVNQAVFKAELVPGAKA